MDKLPFAFTTKSDEGTEMRSVRAWQNKTPKRMHAHKGYLIHFKYLIKTHSLK